MALATFIARFWTAPRKLGLPFVLDRRALAPIAALGLTEARVRGAIRALERIGFLDRAVTNGRTHQRTADGLHRKPVAFTFGADYRNAFSMANKRTVAPRDRRSRVGRTAAPPRASTAPAAARLANSPPVGLANSPKWMKVRSSRRELHLGEKR